VANTGSENTSTPTEFLGCLSTDLAAQSDIDADLAKILADHILTASPQSDCVAKAKQAITDLARTRAALKPKAAQDA
jgi:hypothetical protein